jgi:hypothetical protein
MVLLKTTVVGFVFMLTLILAFGCETADCEDDAYTSDDPREKTAYYTVRIVDQTPVDQLTIATPGSDIDAVALFKGGDMTQPIYADTVFENVPGPDPVYPGLEDPNLATGPPDWPDGDCLAYEVRFYCMGGHEGDLVLGFGEQEIEEGDVIRVYACTNNLGIDSYNLAVGASGWGRDFSFVGYGYNETGIIDFPITNLPALVGTN